MTVKRPAIRYHGGKWSLAPEIIRHFPNHRVYTEAFGGGASILLRKPRTYAEIYNDLDGEIVNLFKVIRDHGDRFAELLRLTPFSREEFNQAEIKSEDAIEQARRTVVRSFMGFGSSSIHKPSGFRSNSNRSGTTPAHDWGNYPKNIRGLVERLQGVVIENRDAVHILTRHDGPDTLHYVDPPYVHSTRSNGKKGNVHQYLYEMTDAQHRELSELLHGLQGMVALSGYPSPLYDELYRDWPSVKIQALADGARPRVEQLWLSPNCMQHDLLRNIA